MRKQIVIPTIVLAIFSMVGLFYLRHRSDSRVPNVQSSIATAPSARSTRTTVVSAARSTRSQTELVFPDSRQRDVTLRTIRMIVDVKADPVSREKAVRALPRNLIPEYGKILTEFLTIRHAEDDSQTGHVLKNDIMDALIGQKTPEPGLAGSFVGIYQDKSQNIVIRDYALQHLVLLSERLDGSAVWDPALIQVEQKLIQETLWQTAEAHDSSMAGTALLGLTQISETHPEVDRNRLGQVARDTTEIGINEAARVTAFQVCARLRVADALPLALQAAQNDSSSIVRISAIGALGLFGNADDVSILNQIAEKSSRFKPVAMLAVKRIQERTR
jgi:hypothetical protein